MASGAIKTWFTRHVSQIFFVIAVLWFGLACYQIVQLLIGNSSTGVIAALAFALVACAAAGFVSYATRGSVTRIR